MGSIGVLSHTGSPIWDRGFEYIGVNAPALQETTGAFLVFNEAYSSLEGIAKPTP